MDYIRTILLDLEIGVKGDVKRNRDGGYTIVINAKLSYEKQLEVYYHEIMHILNGDFDRQDTDAIEQVAHAV